MRHRISKISGLENHRLWQEHNSFQFLSVPLHSILEKRKDFLIVIHY